MTRSREFVDCSLVIPTIDPQMTIRLLQWIATSLYYAPSEILVIDQSGNKTQRDSNQNSNEQGLFDFLRITWSRVNFRSLSKARIEGMYRAKNRCVVFLDDDCFPLTEIFAQFAKSFSTGDEVLIGALQLGAAKSSWLHIKAGIKRALIGDKRDMKVGQFKRLEYVSGGCFAINKAILNSINQDTYLRLHYFEDVYLGLSLWKQVGDRVSLDARILVYHEDQRSRPSGYARDLYMELNTLRKEFRHTFNLYTRLSLLYYLNRLVCLMMFKINKSS